jgi:hypothetical protein
VSIKTSTALIALIGSILAAPMALAGDYHSGANLVCSDCHTMHYSESHTYAGADQAPMDTGGPHPWLLRYAQNDLCLSCHDGSASAPDVLGDNTSAYVRQAGALNKTDGVAPYAPTTGHTLGSADVAPGGSWTGAPDGLACADCHSVHGSTAFRNLESRTGTATVNTLVTYAAGANNTAMDVFEINSGGALAGHYGVDNVWFNEPNEIGSNYGAFCQGCHTLFHGNYEDPNMNVGGWVRHPTSDANLLGSMKIQYKSHTNMVKIMSNSGSWGSATSSDATPSCMTCHKAHGNRSPFGLIFMSGTGTVTEEGDTDGSGIRDLCRQCHDK